MTSARISTLASLRGRIERIESASMESTSEAHDAPRRIALGHASADAMLKGGLAKAAVHEVFCAGHQGASATGFVAGLARRVASRRPLVWVRQDFSELEITLTYSFHNRELLSLALTHRSAPLRPGESHTALVKTFRRALRTKPAP